MFVVVGVNSDKVAGVTLPLDVRVENVRSISMVDHVVGLDVPAATFIEDLKPNVVVKGKEFETRFNPEQAAVELVWRPACVQFGRTALCFSVAAGAGIFPRRLYSDHASRWIFHSATALSLSAMKSILAKMSGMRVLVIGDLIVDDYVTCDAVGMSQEDPTIVVTPIVTKTFVGGAGGVAASRARSRRRRALLHHRRRRRIRKIRA